MFRFEEIFDVVYCRPQAQSDEADALYEVIRAAKAHSPPAPRRGTRPSAATSRRKPLGQRRYACALPHIRRAPDPRRMGRQARPALRSRRSALAEEPPRRAEPRSALPLHVRQGHGRGHHGQGDRPDLPPADGAACRSPSCRSPACPTRSSTPSVSVLARLAFEVARACHGEVQVALLCEESHRYIPPIQSRLRADPPRHRPHRQGRAANTAPLCASSRSARANSIPPCFRNARPCSRCGFPAIATRTSWPAAGASRRARSFLSSLADREAIAFGEAIPTPMRMKFTITACSSCSGACGADPGTTCARANCGKPSRGCAANVPPGRPPATRPRLRAYRR